MNKFLPPDVRQPRTVAEAGAFPAAHGGGAGTNFRAVRTKMKRVYFAGVSAPAWRWLLVGIPFMLFGIPVIFMAGLINGGGIRFSWHHTLNAIKEVRQIWRERR